MGNKVEIDEDAIMQLIECMRIPNNDRLQGALPNGEKFEVIVSGGITSLSLELIITFLNVQIEVLKDSPENSVIQEAQKAVIHIKNAIDNARASREST